MSRSVLILMAGRSGSGAVGAIEAASGRSERSAPAVEPALIELFDVNLYKSGQRAYAAFRRLPQLGRSFRLLSSAASIYLRVPDEDPFEGLAEENGRSAELGLALAFLMLERGSPLSTVAATGMLETPPNGGQDRLIAPVGGLREKFAALGAYVRRRKGGDWGDRLMLLTPLRTLEGAPVAEAHAEDLLALRRAAAEAGVEIDLRPVGSLSAAAQAVKALRRRRHPREWLARIGAAAAVAAFGAMLVAGAMAAGPLKMDFASIPVQIEGGGEIQIKTPVRSRHHPQSDDYFDMPACYGKGGLPHVPFGEGVTLLVSVRSWAPLWAHDFLVVVVGEEGGSLKFYPMSGLPTEARPRRTAGGEIVWGLRIPFGEPAEETMIFILGRKLGGFDQAALEAGVRAALRGAAPGERINAALGHLAQFSRADSMIDHNLRIVDKLDETC